MFSVILASALLIGQPLAAVSTALNPPFDGQYISPTPQNRAVEWWWGSVIGTPAEPNGIPPVFQFLFNQGYPFVFGERNVSTPEYWVDVKGFDHNGAPFDLVIPAENGTVISPPAHREAVIGTWGSIAQFRLSPDLKTYTITFNAPQITGTIVMRSNNDHHFACNDSQTPYFDSALEEGAVLNEAEKVLFSNLGWAVTTPGGIATLDVVINGVPLKFNGQAYHDKNWAEHALNDFVDAWYFGYGQIGKYAFNFVSASAINGTHTLETGYLSRDGVVLQNQCGVIGQKTKDISLILPSGAVIESGITVPAAWVVTYVLGGDSGEKVSFSFSPLAENPARSVYHRFVAKVSGGVEGVEADQVEGWAVVEWLNPSVRTTYPHLQPLA